MTTDAAHDSRLLRVDGLRVTYHGQDGSEVKAVNDVSFDVRPGERVAIVGESGSGKTATCMAIAGFLTRNDVEVSADGLEFDGADLTRRTRSRIPVSTPGLSMVFQDAMTSLDPVWTVGSQMVDAIRGNKRMSKKAAVAEAKDWLRRVGLHDTERIMGNRPYELSGGMRQRVMVALAVCSRPKLLIADEPTSALDASVAREVMELITDMTEELGTALIIVSHDLHLCQEFATKVIVMYAGRALEQAPAMNLDTRARHPYTQALLDCIPTLDNRSLELLPIIPAPGDRTRMSDDGCVFQNRCMLAESRCATMPPTVGVDGGHSLACWVNGADKVLHDQLATAGIAHQGVAS
jgi:oligopeptide/dipeptide ABC transporter ATP-binding protein